MRTASRWVTLVVAGCVLIAGSMEAAPPVGPDRLADFETGFPEEWFTFFGGSTVTTTQLTVGDADPLARPAQAGDNGILEADFNVTDFGGFGNAFTIAGPQDWSGSAGFSFWFYGTGSFLAYQAEISDNRSDPDIDTSERFDFVFVDDFAGWRRIYIPWEDFTRATDFQPGGAPDDGLTLTEVWAWAIVLPLGADVVYFDDFTLVNRVVDDFEDVAPGPLPAGADPDGNPVGYFTFAGASSVSIVAAATPPAPLSFEYGEPNNVIQADLDVTDFAGFIHNFSNDTLDAWVPQDWSEYGGFAFWMFGQNLGTTTFIDLIENRNEGSTTDDAERWTVTIIDDFSGWRYFEFPFADFERKDIGNGAPNDGLTLEEVHGWAFGTLNTGGPVTYHLDGASLYGVAQVPPLQLGLSSGNFDIDEGAIGEIAVKLNRPLGAEDPAQVSIDYLVMPGSATPDRDYVDVGTAGTLTFVDGGPSELTFPLVTLDDTKYEGTERTIIVLSNPVDIEIGFNPTASGSILDNDPFDSRLVDDFERFPHLWETEGNVALDNPEIAAGDPNAVPGQWLWERVLSAVVPLRVEIDIQGGDGSSICNSGNGVVPVAILTTESFDATTVDHTTVTLGAASETHVDRQTGLARRHEEDVDGDGDIDLVFHFRYDETGLGCDPAEAYLDGFTFGGQPITANGVAGFHRDFALGQDWSLSEGLTFWWYGTGSGDPVVLELFDNRAPDPGPAGWGLVWSDEFDGPAGAPPDPANWTHEIGDGTVNGIPGWGNQELQYYTDSTENAATDGAGNLVITVRESDGSLPCYYGPCDYTSARLTSWYKAEFAYGRIETRLRVPPGEGLWPAFWSLGTDIGQVGWPQTGEIDIMEFVGRTPTEIFGTIHGPGYSGGNSFGGIYDFGTDVADEFHTFVIEWGPDEIHWYVDGINFHDANPADVAPNEWVFNDPIFLLTNVAVGGNFGGPVSPGTVFPQELTIDYVRVYQGADTAERWEATFVDDFTGWQQVTIPFTQFLRSAEQPPGAPDDGLGLTEVWGYGFELRGGSAAGSVQLDQVRLLAPAAVVVTNTNDSGPGSLREAIALVADGGSVSFDPALAGQTIALTSGPLVIGKPVAIDGSAVPGLAVSGGGVDRVLIVDPTGEVSIFGLTLTQGFGWQLAGVVLNNGSLTLDHVTVSGGVTATDACQFWQGGGGIYNGGGATLDLVDSTVSDNFTACDGGGVLSFFDTDTSVARSTISDNTAANVGGGIRMLGDADIVNSTLSGNESLAWFGGAVFHTDGVMSFAYSTVAGNIAPSWANAALFVGTFGDASATMTFHDTVIADNTSTGCFAGFFGGGTVTLESQGHNLATDATCNTTQPGDIIIPGGAGLEPLAANGGPTETHALAPASPAIDAANAGTCPATDQRGVARPQGAGCDMGAYEAEP